MYIPSMTEKEKMLAGELYDPSDALLVSQRQMAHSLCRQYNNLDETDEERNLILKKLFGENIAKGVYLQGPIFFDYGLNTQIGENTYANFNFTVLDCAPVNIGKNVFFGPNVAIYTPLHPLRWQERNMFTKPDGSLANLEYAKPISIGDNCWIAGNVTICAGVTIGEGSVIGAGSVVVRDIPSGVVAVGTPCKVLKKIME
jgi:maltose O-acetyltransferase